MTKEKCDIGRRCGREAARRWFRRFVVGIVNVELVPRDSTLLSLFHN